MMRAALRLVLATFVLLGAAAKPAAAQGRSLYWRALDVTARLDEDGRLHVSERLAFVFSGDWNGGERTFRLAWDQELELDSVTRVDPLTGREARLQQGELDRVDRYDWYEGTTLRWRSRRPSDPPFEATEIVYVLDYRLSNILVPAEGGDFVLDHDFAFPDRPGPIRSFSLDLTLDPVWEPPVTFTGRVTRGNLAPGESAVLEIPLVYRAGGTPSGVRLGAPLGASRALALGLLLGVLALAVAFYLAERGLGRFEPLDPVSRIDRKWLDAHLFSLLPEEVGAAWDDRTAAPEVAAVLARMVSEEKLSSEVYRTKGWLSTKDNLRLKLLVPRSTLSGYESSLVDALFFSGDETSTEDVREYYRTVGFNPAATIRDLVELRVDSWLGRDREERSVSKTPTLVLLGAALVLAFGASAGDVSNLVALLVGGACLLGLYGVAAFVAVRSRRRVDRMGLVAVGLVISTGLIALFAVAFVLGNPFRSGALALAGLVLLALALTTSVFNLAKSRDGEEAIGKRKKLLAARRYLQRELRRPEPRLEDSWFPYLLAFGLGPEVDRWFGAHGAAVPETPSTMTPSTGEVASSTSGSRSSSWTGGGGAFGGAGASGSWAAAVGTVASAVPAPSASSDGGGDSGGGGGGGGSSGGGGGGGW